MTILSDMRSLEQRTWTTDVYLKILLLLSFCEEDIPWDKLNVDMLHIGYILLLDALDQEDSQYGTKMAKLLHTAQSRGIKTSIDVVSEAGDRFRKLVCPAMRYTDYCIINEIETSATTGIALRGEDGRLLEENLPEAEKLVMNKLQNSKMTKEELADMFKEKYGVEVEHMTDIGTVVGAHAGPGTVALFFMGESR